MRNNCKLCGYNGEFETTEILTDLDVEAGLNSALSDNEEVVRPVFTLYTCPKCRLVYNFISNQ